MHERLSIEQLNHNCNHLRKYEMSDENVYMQFFMRMSSTQYQNICTHFFYSNTKQLLIHNQKQFTSNAYKQNQKNQIEV